MDPPSTTHAAAVSLTTNDVLLVLVVRIHERYLVGILRPSPRWRLLRRARRFEKLILTETLEKTTGFLEKSILGRGSRAFFLSTAARH